MTNCETFTKLWYHKRALKALVEKRHPIKKVQLSNLKSSIYQKTPCFILRNFSHSKEVIKYLEKYGFSMILNLNDYAISRPILVKGVHEASVTKVFKQYMKPNLRFIDIGANLGYYSLLAASQCPNSKIYSFEPDLKNFQLFSSSITYNQFQDRIQAYCLAVGSENKIITISDLGNNSNSGARFTGDNKEVLRPYIHGENPYFREVEAVQLDSFLPDFKIDLVKIDIEGYEPFAIQGMFNIIKQNKPIIFLEFAPSNLKNIGLTEPEKFLQIFTDMEYNINIINKQGDTISYGREITQFFRDFFQYKAHHLDLLLLPT